MTEWQFIDALGSPLPEAAIEIVDTIDPQKRYELLCQHFNNEFPDMSFMDITPEEERWGLIQDINAHVDSDHFQEVKRDKPLKVLLCDIEHDTNVSSVRNLLSGKKYELLHVYNVAMGDQMRVTLGILEWTDIGGIT